MARSHRPVRRPLTASRALLTLAVAGGVALAPLPAIAAPDDPSTSREAAALVADRSRDLEVVSEKVNEARERLDQQKAAAAKAADGGRRGRRRPRRTPRTRCAPSPAAPTPAAS